MGRAKAAVFPEPVSASPMISRPAGDRREDPTRLLTVLAAGISFTLQSHGEALPLYGSG